MLPDEVLLKQDGQHPEAGESDGEIWYQGIARGVMESVDEVEYEESEVQAEDIEPHLGWRETPRA